MRYFTRLTAVCRHHSMERPYRLSTALYLLLVVGIVGVVSGQSLCDDVEDNVLVVDAATLKRADSKGDTIQDLVGCLTEGGTLIFVDDYAFDITLVVDRDLTIAADADVQWTCKGQPIIQIEKAAVEIVNVTVDRCRMTTGGAPFEVHKGGRLTMQNVKFDGNINPEGSTAVLIGRNSRATVVGCTFKNSIGFGSVVSGFDAEGITIVDSKFENNTATFFGGGALGASGDGVETEVMIKGTAFRLNRALSDTDGEGGAVMLDGNFSAVLDDVRFVKNWSGRRGGGLFAKGSPGLTVDNSFFVENASNFTGGGGIYAENGTLGNMDVVISNTLFSGNKASRYLGSGGGLRIEGDGMQCSLTDAVTFVSNRAELNGGGIYASIGRRLDIVDAIFVGNEVSKGGAAAVFAVSVLGTDTRTMSTSVRDSKFLFNRAVYSRRIGGTVGAVGFGLEMIIDGCLFANNDVGTGPGGAVYIFDGPVVDIMDTTFVNNTAGSGGALYGESDAKYTVESCTFDGNTASQGGAIMTRGDVDVEVRDSDFTRNAVLTEGGAIRVLNFRSGGHEVARLVLHNVSFLGNRAGASLFDDALYGTQTAGGGVLATGNGVFVEILNSYFDGNEASEGGGLNIKGVADCNIALVNTFTNNIATRGGGIHMTVDESIRPSTFKTYFVRTSLFDANTASSGGGIYIGSSEADADEQAPNARIFLVTIEECVFKENTVQLDGGALVVSGVGVRVKSSEFEDNFADSSLGLHPIASGGAVLAEHGAGLDCVSSNFTRNKADKGGALSIEDASVKGTNLLFSENSVSDFGTGGAVAVELSADKDISVINEPVRLRSLIFQCTNCHYLNNNGSNRGGALHVHDRNPSGDLSFLPNCTSDDDQDIEGDVRCTTSYREYLKRLGRRIVRLLYNRFEGNVARVGGGIFVNNPSLINVSDGNDADGMGILEDDTYTAVNASIVFDDNDNFGGGYGKDIATTPSKAYFLGKTSGKERLVVEDFTSGDRLSFVLIFEDALEQRVTVDLNLTANIVFDPSKSKGKVLELSGQDSSRMNADGAIEFTAVRLRGQTNQSYVLFVEYKADPELLTQPIDPSVIEVSVRSCEKGEIKVVDTISKVEECQSIDN